MTRNSPRTNLPLTRSEQLAAAHDAAHLRATRLRQAAIAAFWQQLGARLRHTFFSTWRRGSNVDAPIAASAAPTSH